MFSKVHFSSERQDWPTPRALAKDLVDKYQLNLDVCASAENAVCQDFFTKEQDGLKQHWTGKRVWCNPPYGREISGWVQRCSNAITRPWFEPEWIPDLAVMLLPARTDTRWWHDYVIPYGQVTFIKGRLKFEGAKNAAPFPSAIVVFGSLEGTLTGLRSSEGDKVVDFNERLKALISPPFANELITQHKPHTVVSERGSQK